MSEAQKTIIFYGKDGTAAKERARGYDKPSRAQAIQADAWHGERLDADAIEFMDDVPASEQQRIKDEFGKFDNRQSMDQNPDSLGGRREMGPRHNPGGPDLGPSADRRNLDPATRVDDPKDVEKAKLIKQDGKFVIKQGDKVVGGPFDSKQEAKKHPALAA